MTHDEFLKKYEKEIQEIKESIHIAGKLICKLGQITQDEELKKLEFIFYSTQQFLKLTREKVGMLNGEESIWSIIG